jgi:hypothetical protein
MEQIARGSDLTAGEMQTLRRILAQSFVTKGSVNPTEKNHLLSLGLIRCALGGVMPTPAGKMAARM